MDRVVRVGVIGYGYWGPNLVRNFNRLADLKVCCDLDEGNRAKIASLYPDVAVVRDFDEMLGMDVDAVVIATSAPSHYELAKKALGAGKHVFVEKPITLSTETAQELVALADEKKLTLMVGHLLEYHAAVNEVKRYIESGELGQVRYVYSQRLNLGKVRQDENALWSLAPHDISIILYLLGEEPDEVTCRGESYLTEGVQDVVFCTLHFGSGKLANVHVSWLDPHKMRKLTVVGTKKMLVFDDMESTDKIWIYDKGVGDGEGYLSYGEDVRLRFGDITIPFVQMVEPLATECRHFLDCVESGETPRSDGRDGLRVLRVVEAAQSSLEQRGAPVAIG
ncbi:MAG: gfo/Idh/MocA family oxidoreductase [Actinobacteria bacterium]|nr:MAG: gfo/Idh/MocA family oxidoreductase [Actinomycetota bacterium]